jgi:hypothetical protein
MKITKLIAVAVLLGLAVAGSVLAQEGAPQAERVRFEAVDVYVDSGRAPLAAWQFELAAESGNAIIVGVEGGEHPAFAEPPYYDPAALSHGRIIIASFSTGDDLPAGRTRVARLHMQVTGDTPPDYAVRLQVAASRDGERIDATASMTQGEGA